VIIQATNWHLIHPWGSVGRTVIVNMSPSAAAAMASLDGASGGGLHTGIKQFRRRLSSEL
jgi:hypothetical protein